MSGLALTTLNIVFRVDMPISNTPQSYYIELKLWSPTHVAVNL